MHFYSLIIITFKIQKAFKSGFTKYQQYFICDRIDINILTITTILEFYNNKVLIIMNL